MYNRKMRTKFWINLTTEDISKLSRNTIIIVPFSAIEQHGPHLPLGTDKIILDKILEKLCKKNSKSKDFVILPNLNIGSSSEHASFEGTLSVNSLSYINFCINYLENIFSKKFYKFVFINSHGGQTSHMEIVAKELKAKFKKSKIIKANYFLFNGYEKIISINELSHGYHGGEFETSLMLYLDKENVRINKIKKGFLSSDYKSKKIIGFEKNVKLQWDTKNISKTGIIGNPQNATASKGEKLLKISILTMEKIIKELKLL